MTALFTDHPPMPGAFAEVLDAEHAFAQPDAFDQLVAVADAQWFEELWLPEPRAAACLDHDPELFFAETPQGVETAKAICLDCPMRAECLAGALKRREPHGVWGGELFAAGVVVARKRPRGRPRKNPDADVAKGDIAA